MEILHTLRQCTNRPDAQRHMINGFESDVPPEPDRRIREELVLVRVDIVRTKLVQGSGPEVIGIERNEVDSYTLW